jgi:hypothetical protein
VTINNEQIEILTKWALNIIYEFIMKIENYDENMYKLIKKRIKE